MAKKKTFRVRFTRSIREVGFVDVKAVDEAEASVKANEEIEKGDDALTMLPEEYHISEMGVDDVTEIEDAD